jgi:uncharacterized protein YecE (DUF72 family)
LDLAHSANVAVAYVEQEGRVRIKTRTADFTYMRFKTMREDEPTGYNEAELADIAQLCREAAKDGDVYTFMVNGAKTRAPAAAEALDALLGEKWCNS